ncbi:MAG: SRPBCC domain-containing protein [Cyclobacteriaceae bacterium]
MKDVISKEKVFTQSIDRVWRAISEADEISAWFIQADFKPEVGYNYTFTASEEHGGTIVKGRVLEAAPYTLKYTWMVGDSNVETLVVWTLEEDNGATRLKLEHSGILNYEGEAATEMLGHFNKGWDACILGLEQFFKNEIKEPAH